MQTTTTALWGITLSLYAGGLGIPVPENALLIAGGYALYQEICPPAAGMPLWYAALICGDMTLFILVRWLFTRPAFSALIGRFVRPEKLAKYKKAFSRHGGWTLFLARFTFGIRAAAYIAAGAANYPLQRFFAVDSASVTIQLFLFIGIGYYGSGRIEWAKAAAHEIAILLTVFALLSVLVSVAASMLIKRFAKQKSDLTSEAE
jgi:membrane protein DedA with SNARE-associated domain